MKFEQVLSRSQIRQFLECPLHIYQKDPNWVRPLDQEIEGIFDEQKNHFFKHGEAVRWILKNKGKVIGRVAAFYRKDEVTGIKTGGMGFFECINDVNAAFKLFEKCKVWLLSKGVKNMDGPVNCGENNNYWGLLIEGFTQPAYGMNYNPPYYKDFFECYGFKISYEQYTNHFDINKPLPQRFRNIVERVSNSSEYTFEHIQMKHLDKYVDSVVYVHNKAWQFKDDFREITSAYVRDQFRQMQSIIEEKMIWFVYKGDEPLGFFIAIPDVNQIIKRLYGKLGFWEKLLFMYFKKTNVIDRVRVIIMGVIPEYQGKGLESGLIVKAFDEVKAMGKYREGELSWVGDYNPGMIAIHKATGAIPGKTHVTYSMDLTPSNRLKESQMQDLDEFKRTHYAKLY